MSETPQRQRKSPAAWKANAGRTPPPAPDQPVPDQREAPQAATATATATRTPAPVRKFSAQLDGDTAARFGRVLEELRAAVGPIATRPDGQRLRSGFDVSRVDLLRALLVVAEDDPSVLADVAARVRSHYGATTR